MISKKINKEQSKLFIVITFLSSLFLFFFGKKQMTLFIEELSVLSISCVIDDKTDYYILNSYNTLHNDL